MITLERFENKSLNLGDKTLRLIEKREKRLSSLLGEKPQLYKSLLNNQAQKILKQIPIYQTLNEGSEHDPKFRCIVSVNGVSYKSQNTYHQRKLAETDACRVAFLATSQKQKNEASRLVHEDKSFCKSILAEYAARINIQNFTYQTFQLNMPLPVFRSTLVFNSVSCTGDESRTKKDAEQSAARATILKFLDSESGDIMSEIVTCKFKHFAELTAIKSLNEATVEEVTKMPITSAITEPSLVQDTAIPAIHLSLDASQSQTQEVLTKALIPIVPVPTVLVQIPFSGTHNVPTSNVVQVANTEASSVIVALTSSQKRNLKRKIKLQKKKCVEDRLTLNEARVDEVTKMAITSAVTKPCLVQGTTIPTTLLSVDVSQSQNREISTEALIQSVPVSTVLAKTRFGGTHNESTTNVVQVANTEASNVIVAPISGKKRNRRRKRNSQKKMRVEDQSTIPAIPLTQVPIFNSRHNKWLELCIFKNMQ